MGKKLSEIIRELEDKNVIDDYYLHYGYYVGDLQLNIEFKGEGAYETLVNNDIKECPQCAYWE